MSWLSSLLGWFSGLFSSTIAVPAAIIADIQAATISFCNFMPVAESVQALVAATYPTTAAELAIVEPVAKAICAVVSKTPAMPVAAAKTFVSTFVLMPPSFTVNGVAVQGRWVR